jgi:hypothetical protein
MQSVLNALKNKKNMKTLKCLEIGQNQTLKMARFETRFGLEIDVIKLEQKYDENLHEKLYEIKKRNSQKHVG